MPLFLLLSLKTKIIKKYFRDILALKEHDQPLNLSKSKPGKLINSFLKGIYNNFRLYNNYVLVLLPFFF